MKRAALPVMGILISIILVTTLYYLQDVLAVGGDAGLIWHQRTVAQTIGAPYIYRVMGAYTIEALHPIHTLADYLIAYLAAHLLIFAAFFGILYMWLTAVWNRVYALFGVGLVAFFMSLMFRNSWGATIYTPIEALLFTWALWTLWRLPHTPHLREVFGILVIAASLNRATGVMLPIAYLVLYGYRREHWFQTMIYFGIWAGIFIGLRLIIGPVRTVTPPSRAWMKSLTLFLTESVVNQALFMPVWFLAYFGYRSHIVPPRLKRLAWLFPIYAIPVLVFGQLNEVRLWLTILPVTIPLLLAGLPVSRSAMERASTD